MILGRGTALAASIDSNGNLVTWAGGNRIVVTNADGEVIYSGEGVRREDGRLVQPGLDLWAQPAYPEFAFGGGSWGTGWGSGSGSGGGGSGSGSGGGSPGGGRVPAVPAHPPRPSITDVDRMGPGRSGASPLPSDGRLPELMPSGLELRPHAVDPASGVVKARLKGFSRYAVMAYDRTFADLRGHWGRDEVEVLASRHLVEGVNEREFQPDRSITRAELAKLLVQMLAQDPDRGVTVAAPAQPTFADVAADAWYYDYVETAARHGLVQGYGGRFRPDDPVTREEMTAMVLRAMGLEAAARAAANAALPFRDADQVAEWARGYVAVASQKGLVRGVGGGAFAPAGTATRAQGAALVLRAMELMGMITAPVTVTGTVTVSEIEGRHLELEVSGGGPVTRYVLIPGDGAVARELEASVGRQVRVTGLVEDRPNIYMRGPLLRVLEVRPAG